MGISFVAGQMLNSNLTRDSNLAFNTNTLYINYSGNTVGIGTITPRAALEVAGNIINGNLVISSNVIGTIDGSVVGFSGNSGIAIPYGNSSQRPSPAAVGTLRLNTGSDQLEVWDGTTWLAGSGGTGNTPSQINSLPATEPPLQLCLPKPSSAKAYATSPQAQILWRSSAASNSPLKRSPKNSRK